VQCADVCSRGKMAPADKRDESLLQEMVAVRLIGQTSPWWALGREGSALCPGYTGAPIPAGTRQRV